MAVAPVHLLDQFLPDIFHFEGVFFALFRDGRPDEFLDLGFVFEILGALGPLCQLDRHMQDERRGTLRVYARSVHEAGPRPSRP